MSRATKIRYKSILSKAIPKVQPVKSSITVRYPVKAACGSKAIVLRISAIVDARFSLIVDGETASSWTRWGSAQAPG